MERQSHDIKNHTRTKRNVSDSHISANHNFGSSNPKSNSVVRIGFLTPHNPFDRNSFSGTIYYMRSGISQHSHLELHVIGKNIHRAKFLQRLLRLSGKFGATISKAAHSLHTRLFAFAAEAELRRRDDIDIIVAPVASEILSLFKHTKDLPPIVFVTDATPLFIQDCYNESISPRTIETEQKALSQCANVIYSSRFMAERARKEFPHELNGAQNKVSIIPFGLNADHPPKFAGPKVLSETLELLFVGKDWQRKGGDIALATLAALSEQNIACRLIVIGCEPPGNSLGDNVEVYPYLNKNSPSDRARFEAIQKRSHFLLLPTRGDCTPMVIAEANAFGTPVICTDIGGISTLVQNGVNGQLMQPTDTAETYANTIIELTQNPESYSKLSYSSRKMFEEKLNWQAWSNNFFSLAKRVKNLIKNPEASQDSQAGIALVSDPLNTTESAI